MSGATFAGDGVFFFASMIGLVLLLGASCAILARLVESEPVFPEWFRRGPHQ